MNIDIQQLFNEKIPSKMVAHADLCRGIGATYQFCITGEGGGEWLVDLTPAGPSVQNGNPGRADCTFTLDSTAFQELYASPQSAMQLFFQGRIAVSGNQMVALKLQQFLKLV